MSPPNMAGPEGLNEASYIPRCSGVYGYRPENWEHFAIGAAISGITIVCGENVCGVDPERCWMVMVRCRGLRR